jgi:hypothetical protein
VKLKKNEKFGGVDLGYLDDDMNKYFGKEVTFTIRGDGRTRTITLSHEEHGLFKLGTDVKLILENITLKGKKGNHNALIECRSNSSLFIKAGTSITGHGGTAVKSFDSANITMNGGTISDNEKSGVDFSRNQREDAFVMNGGTITRNEDFGIRVSPHSTFARNPANIFGNSPGDVDNE